MADTSGSRNPVVELLNYLGVSAPWDTRLSNLIAAVAILFFISLLFN